MVRSEVGYIELTVDNCPFCGGFLQAVGSGENCPDCDSRARLRSLAPVVDQFLKNTMAGLRDASLSLPLLSFSMTAKERKVLGGAFNNFKSVSLFGNYSGDHETGVDMRDLSRYASDSFSGVFSCLVLDYFLEQELALQQCFRVIAPGGVFLTHIAPYRLVDGDSAPSIKKIIKPRSGYFEYLPETAELLDVMVGRCWFVAAMMRVGFEVVRIKVQDAVPGLFSEWFVGFKPG